MAHNFLKGKRAAPDKNLTTSGFGGTVQQRSASGVGVWSFMKHGAKRLIRYPLAPGVMILPSWSAHVVNTAR